MKRSSTLAVVCVMSATAVQATDNEALRLEQLANRFVAESLKYDPTVAYETGLPTRVHDRFADHSPRALAARDAEEAAELKALDAIDRAQLPATSLATYAMLKENLESDLQLRVCRRELWNVNHFTGWMNEFAEVADKQPVGTSDLRAQALRRFGSVPHYVNIEIANLRRGLGEGYAAPQSVVRRVIAQLNGLIALPPDKSPYFVAGRDSDPAFRAALKQRRATTRWMTALERSCSQKHSSLVLPGKTTKLTARSSGPPSDLQVHRLFSCSEIPDLDGSPDEHSCAFIVAGDLEEFAAEESADEFAGPPFTEAA
jgi:uncharacterized protein (DUF885 family)